MAILTQVAGQKFFYTAAYRVFPRTALQIIYTSLEFLTWQEKVLGSVCCSACQERTVGVLRRVFKFIVNFIWKEEMSARAMSS
jgi:hypothetical protein